MKMLPIVVLLQTYLNFFEFVCTILCDIGYFYCRTKTKCDARGSKKVTPLNRKQDKAVVSIELCYRNVYLQGKLWTAEGSLSRNRLHPTTNKIGSGAQMQ